MNPMGFKLGDNVNTPQLKSVQEHLRGTFLRNTAHFPPAENPLGDGATDRKYDALKFEKLVA
jgi:hypothetical protein